MKAFPSRLLPVIAELFPFLLPPREYQPTSIVSESHPDIRIERILMLPLVNLQLLGVSTQFIALVVER